MEQSAVDCQGPIREIDKVIEGRILLTGTLMEEYAWQMIYLCSCWWYTIALRRCDKGWCRHRALQIFHQDTHLRSSSTHSPPNIPHAFPNKAFPRGQRSVAGRVMFALIASQYLHVHIFTRVFKGGVMSFFFFA